MTGAIITHHAAERFVERHAPGMAYAEARAFLAEASKTAVRLRECTLLGQSQWEIAEPRCVLVVKHDKDAGPVVVTVLSAREPFGRAGGDLESPRAFAARLPSAADEAPRLAEVERAKAKNLRASGSPRPKGRKGSPAGHLSKDPAVREAQVEAMALALRRDEEKTRRHNEAQMLLIGRLKRALRAAARALVRRAASGDAEALAALEAIQREDPGYVTAAFLTGEKVGREVAMEDRNAYNGDSESAGGPAR